MFAILLILAGQPADAQTALVHYRAVTAVGPHCDTGANGTDITVCARRNADRYRLPLIEQDAGSPKIQNVSAERERLFASTSNCQEKSLFLVGCGKVGVGATAGFGPGGIYGARLRPLAP
jgi:hypothetical protein